MNARKFEEYRADVVTALMQTLCGMLPHNWSLTLKTLFVKVSNTFKWSKIFLIGIFQHVVMGYISCIVVEKILSPVLEIAAKKTLLTDEHREMEIWNSLKYSLTSRPWITGNKHETLTIIIFLMVWNAVLPNNHRNASGNYKICSTQLCWIQFLESLSRLLLIALILVNLSEKVTLVLAIPSHESYCCL